METSYGKEITLDKDIYIYDSRNTINLPTKIVIDGNGAIIDMYGAPSSMQVFYASASAMKSGDEIIIKNLIFKNHNREGKHGAILDIDVPCTIINCTFENNTGVKGIAFFSDDKYTCNLINCTFVNNHAYYMGESVIRISGGNVENCVFANNTYQGSIDDITLIYASNPITINDNCWGVSTTFPQILLLVLIYHQVGLL